MDNPALGFVGERSVTNRLIGLSNTERSHKVLICSRLVLGTEKYKVWGTFSVSSLGFLLGFCIPQKKEIMQVWNDISQYFRVNTAKCMKPQMFSRSVNRAVLLTATIKSIKQRTVIRTNDYYMGCWAGPYFKNRMWLAESRDTRGSAHIVSLSLLILPVVITANGFTPNDSWDRREVHRRTTVRHHENFLKLVC